MPKKNSGHNYRMHWVLSQVMICLLSNRKLRMSDHYAQILEDYWEKKTKDSRPSLPPVYHLLPEFLNLLEKLKKALSSFHSFKISWCVCLEANLTNKLGKVPRTANPWQSTVTGIWARWQSTAWAFLDFQSSPCDVCHVQVKSVRFRKHSRYYL